MKFDTPATTNPIDQLKMVGQPTDRIDGPLKTTGTAPLRLRAARRRCPNPAYGVVVGAAIAKGRIAVMDTAPRRRRPASSPIVTARNAGKLGKGEQEHRQAARRPRDRALPPGDRRWSWPRRSSRRATPRADRRRLRAARTATSTSPRQRTARRSSRSETPQSGAGAGRSRRLRRRLRRGAGEARRDLHDARPEPRDDGAARVDRGLGRRQAHAVDVQPDDRLGRGRCRQDARHAQGERAPRSRRSSAAASAASCSCASDAVHGRARRARRRPAGEGRARAPADDQQHDPPAGDHPAHPHRRGARRPASTAIAHESWSGDLPGGGPETAVNQTRLLYAGANRMTRDAPRRARPARGQRHARAGRGRRH